LRDKVGVQARFLLGAAGTGKTFLCLKEIREALQGDPSGPPLVLLAPKQATFQLERQLLAEAEPAGYTRLQILSFERLAKFLLDDAGAPPPPMLSEEGRQMVLQGLLARRRGELRIFHASTGLAGFARQLSVELREWQRRQVSVERLRQLASGPELGESLRRKLHDLALLLGDYQEWLRRHELQDVDCLLDLAAESVKSGSSRLMLGGLWMDGFAEMTPQELDLLAALARRCGKMTLAFCLEDVPARGESSWLSIWSGITQTFLQCRSRLVGALGAENVTVEVLRRGGNAGRFAESAVLRELEEKWTRPEDALAGSAPGLKESLRVAWCANPAAEAVLAAQEILRFVRGGGRFREAAVLVRRMEGYHDHVRRALTRYGIPFFLDRREGVAQHPAAELTRSALRAAAYDWRNEDWFGALKTGLVTADEEAIDRLENEALARGWKGEAWFQPLPPDENNSDWAERWRRKWIGPFLKFRKLLSSVKYRPSGSHLAEAVGGLWADLGVGETLRDWSEGEGAGSAVHATLWQQINAWRENVALAFAGEAMPLRDWLPILEAGLAGLSVGVIPPALDQVLVGAIDRSRNPELKLAIVLGVNETVFPAAPAAGSLFGETDREELAARGIPLGHGRRELLARERFFGYIACTRSRQRLVLTGAQRDSGDQPLNPSPFFAHLKGLFPQLEIEAFAGPDWRRAEHSCELASQWGRAEERGPRLRELFGGADFASWREQWAVAPANEGRERLPAELAGRLYGPALKTSVSRLEEFAACAFKFFVHSGLRAEERQRFELDVRERGSFQHAVLAGFHQRLREEGKRWRDIGPAEGRRRIQETVGELLPRYREGLLASSAQGEFAARAVSESLQDFVAATLEWMAHYQFDPREAELGFGTREAKLPAWELDLGGGDRLLFRGIIDRVDLCASGTADEALAVVIDYKSSQRKLDKVKMAHGLQLQLAAYLSFLRQVADAREIFGVSRLVPAGVFYVNLRGQSERAETRTQVFQGREEFLRKRFQHSGRFDWEALPRLDDSKGGDNAQFKFKVRLDGKPYANNTDGMPTADFVRLLGGAEAELLRMGREIYEGVIEVSPYQKGSERACTQCEYQSICRFDPWEQPYRVLKNG
jgi:ATP-dependent helicase/nuclease subunit B